MKISWNHLKRFLAGASIALVLGGCTPKQVTPKEDTVTTQSDAGTLKEETEAISEFVEALKEEQDAVVDFFGEEAAAPVTEEMKQFLEEKKIPKEYLEVPYLTNVMQQALDADQVSGITYDNGSTKKLNVSLKEEGKTILYQVCYNDNAYDSADSSIYVGKRIYLDCQNVDKERPIVSTSIYYNVTHPKLSFSEMIDSKDEIGTRCYTPEYDPIYYSTAYEYANSGFDHTGFSASGESVKIDKEEYLSLRNNTLTMFSSDQGKKR